MVKPYKVTKEVLNNVATMIEDGCTITAACKANKISLDSYRRYRLSDEEFRKRIEAADEDINFRLEKSMVKLALEDCYYPAIKFLLETRMRNVYGKKDTNDKGEGNGKDDERNELRFRLSELTNEELGQVAAIAVRLERDRKGDGKEKDGELREVDVPSV